MVEIYYNYLMKFINLTVYRLADKKVLLSAHHSASSSQMQQRAEEDFTEMAKSFRKSGLYDGMRESNMELAEEFPPELAMELGGAHPIWYSTCDQNLLIYSGKFPHSFDPFAVMCNKEEVPHSQAAFAFLKEVTRTIEALVPQLKHDHDIVGSIQGQAGSAVSALLDENPSRTPNMNTDH